MCSSKYPHRDGVIQQKYLEFINSEAEIWPEHNVVRTRKEQEWNFSETHE